MPAVVEQTIVFCRLPLMSRGCENGCAVKRDPCKTDDRLLSSVQRPQAGAELFSMLFCAATVETGTPDLVARRKDSGN
jgi:hypothetical protein